MHRSPTWCRAGRPTADKIALLRGSSPYQLYVMNADGSGEAQVAPSPAYDPDWSPNGKTIAYARCGLSGFRSCRVAFANVGTSTQAEPQLG